MIISAGITETYDWATPVGVGFNAAIKLSELIMKNNPKRIVFVGSMGLYSKDYELFSIHRFNAASNVELSVLDDLSYSPIMQQIYKINSSNYICKNYEKAQKMHSQYGFIGENMEVFAIFETAKYYKIPAIAYLIATNYCDETAHEEYLKNYELANAKLEDYLENIGIL